MTLHGFTFVDILWRINFIIISYLFTIWSKKWHFMFRFPCCWNFYRNYCNENKISMALPLCITGESKVYLTRHWKCLTFFCTFKVIYIDKFRLQIRKKWTVVLLCTVFLYLFWLATKKVLLLKTLHSYRCIQYFNFPWTSI